MKHSSVVPRSRLILVCLARFVLPGSIPVSAVAEPFQISPGTVNQQVTVVGRLELAGKNYFLDPRFVIVDDQNIQTIVTAWAPLELPPAPPGVPHPVSQSTMQNYLHQQLSFVGIHRVVAGTSGPITLGAPGDDYLEVTSVVDVATGVQILKAATSTAPFNGKPDPKASPVTGTQPTGTPVPAGRSASPPGASQPTQPQQRIAAAAAQALAAQRTGSQQPTTPLLSPRRPGDPAPPVRDK
jgi:hypothetical protein